MITKADLAEVLSQAQARSSRKPGEPFVYCGHVVNRSDPPSFDWRAGFHGYKTIVGPNEEWLAGKAERDRLAALGVEVETWC